MNGTVQHSDSAVTALRQLLPCSIDRSNRGNSDTGRYHCQRYWVSYSLLLVFFISDCGVGFSLSAHRLIRQ